MFPLARQAYCGGDIGDFHLASCRIAAMNYPSAAEVIAADQPQISFWWAFLPDPQTPAEEHVMDLIFKKFYVDGGFISPEISRKTGHTALKRKQERAAD